MPYHLEKINDHLSLISDEKKFTPISIDFLDGQNDYRRKNGGGKNQLIAKAVGIKPNIKLTIFDATAGLGRDAFVLACLGCNVLMCERSPIISALLEDALIRAKRENHFRSLSLEFIQDNAIDYLNNTKTIFDVVYIDPMFPEREKSALVKKEMRILRDIVGDDMDSEKLFDIALKTAKKRVVVKRAKLAPTVTTKKPDIVFIGKSSRFDVYTHYT